MEQDFKYSKHEVAVIYNENESQAVLEGLKCIQAENDIGSEDVVVITPNWVDNKKSNPSEAVVVGPETLRTIIRWVKARNPIAVDSVCARLFGFMEQGVGYIHLLKNKGFAETDLKSIPMKGLTLEEAEKIFSTKVYGEQMVLDTK